MPANKFGEDLPEFKMLRQVYAQRILQGTIEPGKRLAKISPEIQQIMFPGESLKQMQDLAKEMDFLLGTRGGMKGTAQGMSAMAKVENPWSHIVGHGGDIMKVVTAPIEKIPGGGAIGRYILGKYFSLVTQLATSPATMRWIEKGLNGTPEEKAVVRAALMRSLQRGGAVGAGVGESEFQNVRQQSQ